MEFEKWTKSGVPEEATLEVGHHVWNWLKGVPGSIICSWPDYVSLRCARMNTFLLLRMHVWFEELQLIRSIVFISYYHLQKFSL